MAHRPRTSPPPGACFRPFAIRSGNVVIGRIGRRLDPIVVVPGDVPRGEVEAEEIE
jgi:hypothetical protein